MLWAIVNRGHISALLPNSRFWLDNDHCKLIIIAQTSFKTLHVFNWGKRPRNLLVNLDFVILMRKDPVWHAVLYSLYLLEYAQRAGVLVVNNPEKAYVTVTKTVCDAIPEADDTDDCDQQTNPYPWFYQNPQDVIDQTAWWYGEWVFFVWPPIALISAQPFEMLTQLESLPVMAKYLPEIRTAINAF